MVLVAYAFAALVVIPVVVLWTIERLVGLFRPSVDAQLRDEERRLVSPDWSCFERHLGRSAPEALRAIYADREILLAQVIDYSPELPVISFAPLDQQGLEDSTSLAGEPVFAFAYSETGDPIYLERGTADRDAVYVIFHDGGDRHVVAESIDEFVARVRERLDRARQSR